VLQAVAAAVLLVLAVFGNNAVRANGADGAFSGPVGLQ